MNLIDKETGIEAFADGRHNNIFLIRNGKQVTVDSVTDEEHQQIIDFLENMMNVNRAKKNMVKSSTELEL